MSESSQYRSSDPEEVSSTSFETPSMPHDKADSVHAALRYNAKQNHANNLFEEEKKDGGSEFYDADDTLPAAVSLNGHNSLEEAPVHFAAKTSGSVEQEECTHSVIGKAEQLDKNRRSIVTDDTDSGDKALKKLVISYTGEKVKKLVTLMQKTSNEKVKTASYQSKPSPELWKSSSSTSESTTTATKRENHMKIGVVVMFLCLLAVQLCSLMMGCLWHASLSNKLQQFALPHVQIAPKLASTFDCVPELTVKSGSFGHADIIPEIDKTNSTHEPLLRHRCNGSVGQEVDIHPTPTLPANYSMNISAGIIHNQNLTTALEIYHHLRKPIVQCESMCYLKDKPVERSFLYRLDKLHSKQRQNETSHLYAEQSLKHMHPRLPVIDVFIHLLVHKSLWSEADGLYVPHSTVYPLVVYHHGSTELVVYQAQDPKPWTRCKRKINTCRVGDTHAHYDHSFAFQVEKLHQKQQDYQLLSYIEEIKLHRLVQLSVFTEPEQVHTQTEPKLSKPDFPLVVAIPKPPNKPLFTFKSFISAVVCGLMSSVVYIGIWIVKLLHMQFLQLLVVSTTLVGGLALENLELLWFLMTTVITAVCTCVYKHLCIYASKVLLQTEARECCPTRRRRMPQKLPPPNCSYSSLKTYKLLLILLCLASSFATSDPHTSSQNKLNNTSNSVQDVFSKSPAIAFQNETLSSAYGTQLQDKVCNAHTRNQTDHTTVHIVFLNTTQMGCDVVDLKMCCVNKTDNEGHKTFTTIHAVVSLILLFVLPAIQTMCMICRNWRYILSKLQYNLHDLLSKFHMWRNKLQTFMVRAFKRISSSSTHVSGPANHTSLGEQSVPGYVPSSSESDVIEADETQTPLALSPGHSSTTASDSNEESVLPDNKSSPGSEMAGHLAELQSISHTATKENQSTPSGVTVMRSQSTLGCGGIEVAQNCNDPTLANHLGWNSRVIKINLQPGLPSPCTTHISPQLNCSDVTLCVMKPSQPPTTLHYAFSGIQLARSTQFTVSSVADHGCTTIHLPREFASFLDTMINLMRRADTQSCVDNGAVVQYNTSAAMRNFRERIQFCMLSMRQSSGASDRRDIQHLVTMDKAMCQTFCMLLMITMNSGQQPNEMYMCVKFFEPQYVYNLFDSATCNSSPLALPAPTLNDLHNGVIAQAGNLAGMNQVQAPFMADIASALLPQHHMYNVMHSATLSCIESSLPLHTHEKPRQHFVHQNMATPTTGSTPLRLDMSSEQAQTKLSNLDSSTPSPTVERLEGISPQLKLDHTLRHQTSEDSGFHSLDSSQLSSPMSISSLDEPEDTTIVSATCTDKLEDVRNLLVPGEAQTTHAQASGVQIINSNCKCTTNSAGSGLPSYFSSSWLPDHSLIDKGEEDERAEEGDSIPHSILSESQKSNMRGPDGEELSPEADNEDNELINHPPRGPQPDEPGLQQLLQVNNSPSSPTSADTSSNTTIGIQSETSDLKSFNAIAEVDLTFEIKPAPVLPPPQPIEYITIVDDHGTAAILVEQATICVGIQELPSAGSYRMPIQCSTSTLHRAELVIGRTF